MPPAEPPATKKPTETAVLVLLPEADEVVGPYRARMDRAAVLGVPAHVTVLYPFVPPHDVDARVIDALAGAVASVPAFDVAFDRTAWFDNRVLWLAPAPSDPFRDLTRAVWARFPAHPPYGGAHDDVIPHLTVGHDVPVDALRAAAGAIEPRLPVRARVTRAWLLRGSAERGSWQRVVDLPLGAGPAEAAGTVEA
jgi:2'-5' RNA ligase